MWSSSFFVLYFILSLFADKSKYEVNVANGMPAKPGQFPSIVALLRYSKLHCGGTLISRITVLTAAHCLTFTNLKELSILAGSINIRKFEKGYQKRKVKKAIVHMGFTDIHDGQCDDIALLTLDSPIDITKYVRPIAYKPVNPPVGASVEIAGWGLVKDALPDDLQYATASVHNVNICPRNLIGNKEKVLCLRGSVRPYTSARPMDSGSPAYYRGTVVGVVSRGVDFDGYGVVYTRTSYYSDFIREQFGHQTAFD